MTTILRATCQAGVVKVDGRTVTPAPTILTQGTKSSSGILLIDEHRTTYVATNTTDLVDTLDKVQSSLGTLASSLTAIATAVGDLGLIAAMAAAAATINATAAELGAMKGNLK